MSDHPRPDLSRILPRPVLHSSPARSLPLQNGLSTEPPAAAGPDYLVEVERKEPVAASDVAFGIRQALAVADRVRQSLHSAPRPTFVIQTEPPTALLAVHRPQPERVQQRLFESPLGRS